MHALNLAFCSNNMRFTFEDLWDSPSSVPALGAVVLLAITAILRYGFEIWWPWGIMMAIVCAIVAMLRSGSD